MKTSLIALILLCAVMMATPASAAICESLSNLKLTNTTITSAQAVAPGAFTPPAGSGTQQPGAFTAFNALPAFCRVQGVLTPSSDSHIEFEVWLPASGWNGKYQGIGNGGFAGSIGYSNLADAIAHNYATASTDTGHKANAIDARWALGHPEKIIDFGYRAIHETAVTAKAIIRAFYGKRPKRSYFNSCSNGGRQALMEAQRFPEDYDGIISGAPALFWTHLNGIGIWDTLVMSDTSSYLSAGKLPAIQEAVLAECDMLDKVKDGVLEDPARCRFDASKLNCSGTETDRCLVDPQIATLKKLYAGPRNAKGAQLAPGYAPGAEADPQGWELWITGKQPGQGLITAFGTQFFQNMVYDNPSWDFHTFNWDRDVKVADEKLAHILNATNPDLTQFKKRGGKLIIYHGWDDAAIPAQFAIDYYKSVLSKMGKKNADEFVRLFMVPGMQHCAGGAGCDTFGQFTMAQGDPEHDINAALERWVEKGIAPSKIIAAKIKTDGKPAGEVVRTHPLCPYPQVAKYKGSGSADDAANFACAEGK